MYQNPDILINSLKQKKKDAFEYLFFKYHGSLVAVSLKYTYDSDVAKDLVQDLFMSLWEKADKLNFSPSVKAYLFKSVRNLSLNYIRDTKISNNAKNDISKSIFDTEITPYQSLVTKEIERIIKDTIINLPEKSKEVYQLSRVKLKMNKEIADELGVSIKYVEKHMTIARKILKEKLEHYRFR